MGSPSTATRRVLVIDDDPGYGRMAYRYLQTHGFQARLAPTGTKGQVQIEAFKPEIILLDIHLPDIDGIALYKALKIDPRTRDIPIILITAEVYLDSLLEAAVKGLQAESVFFKGNADMLGLMQRIRETLENPCQKTEPAKVSDKKILIIDDDLEVQDLVRLTLAQKYPHLQFCDRGKEGFHLTLEHRPDLILLDMVMPDLNGIGVFKLLKSHDQTKDIPVLVMTGMPEEGNVIKDAVAMLGASDFVHKPFGEDELLRHVDRLIRSGPTHPPAILEKGPLKLDVKSRSVWICDEPLTNLSPKEFDLLAYLVGKSPAVAKWPEILMNVWGQPVDVSSENCPHEAIEVRSRTLRAKLGEAGCCIVTHKGVGLQFDSGRFRNKPAK